MRCFIAIIIILTIICCKNKNEKFDIIKGKEIISINEYQNDADIIHEVKYQDKNGFQNSEIKFINGKIHTRVDLSDNDSLWIITKFNSEGKKKSIDTLVISKKYKFPVGWSWSSKNGTSKKKEFFRIGNKSFQNQEKLFRNGEIIKDSSAYYTLSKKDSQNYVLNLNLPKNVPDSIMVALCLSSKINHDFSNINSITDYDTIWPQENEYISWTIPKEKRKNLKGFIEILRVYYKEDGSVNKIYEKKIYINRSW